MEKMNKLNELHRKIKTQKIGGGDE